MNVLNVIQWLSIQMTSAIHANVVVQILLANQKMNAIVLAKEVTSAIGARTNVKQIQQALTAKQNARTSVRNILGMQNVISRLTHVKIALQMVINVYNQWTGVLPFKRKVSVKNKSYLVFTE